MLHLFCTSRAVCAACGLVSVGLAGIIWMLTVVLTASTPAQLEEATQMALARLIGGSTLLLACIITTPRVRIMLHLWRFRRLWFAAERAPRRVARMRLQLHDHAPANLQTNAV